LIRQERFFSSVYIVGTGLAISMVMALAVAYPIRTANMAPEVHRDRMCYLSNVTYKLNGTKSNYKAACGSVVWQRTLSIDDIAARVVDKRSEYRKETLITTFGWEL